MRGKVGYRSRNFLTFRITPAYAGKRFKSFIDGLRIEDHPRLCGEKLPDPELPDNRQGSPPPMRGKASGFDSVIAVFGITPAYAGKSFLSTSRAFCN